MSRDFVVTGASGFCGAEILKVAQRRGFTVASLGRSEPRVSEVDHVYIDFFEPQSSELLNALKRADVGEGTVVVHAAATVGDSGSQKLFAGVNIDGTRALLTACKELGAKVVHISSASVYRTALDGPVVESAPTGPHRDYYSATKSVADGLALEAGAVVLRPRAVYGVGDPHLLPRLLHVAARGWLPLPGLSTSMSVTSVELLADAALQAASWDPGCYNVADLDSVDRDEAIRMLLRKSGLKTRIVHPPQAASVAVARRLEQVLHVMGLRSPISGYAVAQVAYPILLDTSKAHDAGLRPMQGTWQAYVDSLPHN